MIYYVETIVKAVIVTWSACLFFRIFEQKSEQEMWKKRVGIIVGVLGLIACGLLSEDLFWLRLVLELAILTISMFLYRGMEVRNTVYLTIFYYVVVVLIGHVSYLLLFPIVWILKRIMNRKPSMFAMRNEWFAFSLIPLFSLITYMCIAIKTELPGWCRVVLVLGLCGCNIALFYIFSDLIKKQKLLVRERILKTGLEGELENYKTIHQALEQQRSRSHEFKNYINAIYYMIELEKYDEVIHFIHSVRGSMHTKTEAIYHTGHLLADAIFNAKYKEALAMDIRFEIEADSLNGLFIKDEDVVVIFSNLLNNALEAASKCESNRYIFMQITQEDAGLRIRTENSHSNAIRSEGDKLLTSKETDADSHGFGIENIKKAVAKYDGSCDISYTDKKFVTDIFLHSETQKL